MPTTFTAQTLATLGAALALTCVPAAPAQEVLTLPPPEPEYFGALGSDLAVLDDVDGDGVADLAASEPRRWEVRYMFGDSGRVHVYSGATGERIRTIRRWIDVEFGRSIAPIGDIDGDGSGDLAIAAPLVSNANGKRGRIYVYSGGAGTLLYTIHTARLPRGTRIGSAVVPAGDVNRDGRPDLLVLGSDRRSNRAYFFSGTTGEFIRSFGPRDGAEWTERLAPVGDVNGDGYDDVAVGDYRAVPLENGLFEGRAYVFSGRSGRLIRTMRSPAHELQGPGRTEGGQFGVSVAGIEDLDGDGRPEVLVGAPGWSYTRPGHGAVYIYSGRTNRLLGLIRSPQSAVGFGGEATAGPDVDGDGLDDILIAGAVEPDASGEGSVGAVYIVSSATRQVLERIEVPEVPGALGIGRQTAVLPDTNGDGREDLAVGAPAARIGYDDVAGTVFIIRR